MTDQTTHTHTHVGVTPRQLKSRDKEMIPVVLLRAMLILAISSLLVVGYAVLTDRPLTGQPLPAPVVAERQIVLDGSVDGSVTVTTPEGALLADLGPNQAGFVSVVWRAMARERMLHDVAALAPVRLVEYENGRLAIHDDLSGWQVELASFGAGNRAAFARLLD